MSRYHESLEDLQEHISWIRREWQNKHHPEMCFRIIREHLDGVVTSREEEQTAFFGLFKITKEYIKRMEACKKYLEAAVDPDKFPDREKNLTLAEHEVGMANETRKYFVKFAEKLVNATREAEKREKKG